MFILFIFTSDISDFSFGFKILFIQIKFKCLFFFYKNSLIFTLSYKQVKFLEVNNLHCILPLLFFFTQIELLYLLRQFWSTSQGLVATYNKWIYLLSSTFIFKFYQKLISRGLETEPNYELYSNSNKVKSSHGHGYML